MPFNEETQETYEAIRQSVDEINQAFKLDLKLREIRLDMFNK